jgi:aldose 1-epimerase
LVTADIVLLTDGLGLAATPEGGAIWRFFARHRNGEIPLFRAPAPGESRPVLASACFPLVPFGNRVRNNRFRFGKRDWQLHPNTHADPITSMATAGSSNGG